MVATPPTIDAMMSGVATSILSARASGVKLGIVELPLPVTGGTELDDWPGGIKQKFNTLVPMLEPVLRRLNFSSSAFAQRTFLGEFGEEDSIGLFQDGPFCVVAFPTPESIEELRAMLRDGPQDRIIVLVNPQIFLDPMSVDTSKGFMASAETIYSLVQLNLKGLSGYLPVRGILFREYPGPYLAGRRLDAGGYTELQRYATKPPRAVLDELFMEDSRVRDRDLTFAQRLQKLAPNFGDKK